MDANERESKIKNDAPPLHLRPLEVDEERDSQAGCFQVIDTLSHVLRAKLFNTLQLHNKSFFDNQIRKVFSDERSFVHYGIGSLLHHRFTTQDQFLRQRSLVDFFQEPTSQGVRDLIRSSDNFFNQQFN